MSLSSLRMFNSIFNFFSKPRSFTFTMFFSVIVILLCGLLLEFVAVKPLRTYQKVLIEDINKKDKEIKALNKKIDELNLEISNLKSIIDTAKINVNIIKHFSEEVSRGNYRKINVEVTAYDLSVESCGKSISHPAYGITASGKSLRGHSLESARAVAVDPNIIPLGSRILLEFTSPTKQHLNGVYTAVDTGGAIKGNRIDLFFGDFESHYPDQSCFDFGRQQAVATIVH